MKKAKRKSGFIPYKKTVDEFGNVTNGPTKEEPIVPYKIKKPTEEQLKLQKEAKKEKKENFELACETYKKKINENLFISKASKENSVPKPKSKTKKIVKSKVVYEKGKTYKSTKKYTPKFKSL